IHAGDPTMNAIRSLTCLLLVLPLLSACSNDTVGAAEPSFEPAGVVDEAAPPDSGATAASPGSPFEADAPPARTPDVIYVPTPQPVVDAMLEMAGVGPDDVLYDLGSGDGRIQVTAALRFGIRA